MFAETILTATAAFFATIGPFDVAAVYAVLTTRSRQEEKRAMAIRGVLLAGVILLVFALVGTALLERLGISMPAFRAAGGVLLLLVGIEMVFARDSTATSTTPEEQQEAQTRQDISVFSFGHAAHRRPWQHERRHVIFCRCRRSSRATSGGAAGIIFGAGANAGGHAAGQQTA